MTKHHVRTNKDHSHKSEAGFFSIRSFMTRNDKLIIVLVGVGTIILVSLSLFMIFSKNKEDQIISQIVPTPVKTVTTPYPTIPQEVVDTTVMVNRRALLPTSVTIKAGGSVGFFNEDEAPVTIQGYDAVSKILDIGPIATHDVPVVTFTSPGVYKYINPLNPQDVSEIIVE